MWRKSSYSPDGNNCVEIGTGIGIRDSKALASHIALSPSAWTAFIEATKGDQFGRA